MSDAALVRRCQGLLARPPSPAYTQLAQAFCALHGAAPAPCDVLVAQGVVGLTGEGCRGERMRQAAIASLQLEDLVDVSATLEAAGIAHVVLKGLPLAHELYGAIALRFSGDIDLLVAPGALRAARAALVAAGHRHAPSGYADGSVESFVCRGHASALEVHGELSTAEGFRALAGELLARPRRLGLGGARQVPVPERGAHLAYLMVHLARHIDAPRAIWMEDIRRLALALAPDEHGRFLDVCARTRLGVAAHVGASLVAAGAALAAAPGLPAALTTRLARACSRPEQLAAAWLVAAIAAHAQEGRRRHAYSLLIAPGWPARAGVVGRALGRRLRQRFSW